MQRVLWLSLLTSVLLGAQPAAAVERPYRVTEQRETCRDFEPLRRPLFGDTHVHTAYSFDASTQDTRNTPRDAYRFARGERVGLQPYDRNDKALRSAKLRRPLDFTVVSDHAEMLGEVRTCTTPAAPGYDSDMCWLYRAMPPVAFMPFASRTLVGRERFQFCGPGGELCYAASRSTWQDIRAAAESAYDRSKRCRFTSFVGYEWTASAGTGANLHRNVVFRNEKVPDLPPSWVETESAYALWQQLQEKCVDAIAGCDALTIPHNSNISGPGLMFETAKLRNQGDAGLAVDAQEARLRRRWEPVIEIMQHKGDSECLLGGDTTDEACGFEKLPYDTFAGVQRIRLAGTTVNAPDRRATVREALKKGLVQEEQLGENSLKYGILASTDTHLGTPGLTLEDDPKGHGGAGVNASFALPIGLPDDLEFNPGGLAVTWAEENTRDAIFAAMQRREVYGTSGTRPVVRFFGGWDYAPELCSRNDFAAAGYAGGVPMGGDLPAQPPGKDAPSFAVSALKDPGVRGARGTPLQRVQIVKGWVAAGEAHERVYEVAGGDNGAEVDSKTCRTQGPGSESLCALWTDPDFAPEQRAFYYARILENPTCRWSQHVCVAAKVDCKKPETVTQGFEGCCSDAHRKTVQERAWTSPIWYSPAP